MLQRKERRNVKIPGPAVPWSRSIMILIPYKSTVFSKWCHSTRKVLKAELWYILKQGWTFFNQNKNPNIIRKIYYSGWWWWSLNISNYVACSTFCHTIVYFCTLSQSFQTSLGALACIKLNSAKACERSEFTFSWNVPTFATWLKVTIFTATQTKWNCSAQARACIFEKLMYLVNILQKDQLNTMHTVLKTCSLNLSVKAPSWNSAVYPTLKRLLYL